MNTKSYLAPTLALLTFSSALKAQSTSSFSHVSFLQTFGTGNVNVPNPSTNAGAQVAFFQEPGVSASQQISIPVTWDSNSFFGYRNSNGNFANIYNAPFNNGVDDEVWCLSSTTDGIIQDLVLAAPNVAGKTAQWMVFLGQGPNINVGPSLASLQAVTPQNSAFVTGNTLVIDTEAYLPEGGTEAEMSTIQVGLRYIPEPSSSLLLCLSGAGFLFQRKRC